MTTQKGEGRPRHPSSLTTLPVPPIQRPLSSKTKIAQCLLPPKSLNCLARIVATYYWVLAPTRQGPLWGQGRNSGETVPLNEYKFLLRIYLYNLVIFALQFIASGPQRAPSSCCPSHSMMENEVKGRFVEWGLLHGTSVLSPCCCISRNYTMCGFMIITTVLYKISHIYLYVMPVQNQSIYNSLPKIHFIQASLFLKKKIMQHKYNLFNT